MTATNVGYLVQFAFIIGAVLFVIGLHLMKSPATARAGNRISAAGMVIAVAAEVVLVTQSGVGLWNWVIIIGGLALGGGLGLRTARTVAMTSMPQLVSVFNAVGGGAAALLALNDFIDLGGHRVLAGGAPGLDGWRTFFIVADIVIGSVTFTGSLIASAKLMGRIRGRPILLPGGRILSWLVVVCSLSVSIVLILAGAGAVIYDVGVLNLLLLVALACALAFGVLMVLPIGGADMPVVISLLNAFTGTAVSMAGFVVGNVMLIVAGALVGASGAILTRLMATAMNRSIANIIVGGFGAAEGTQASLTGVDGTVREVSVDDAAIQLAYASKVVIVPGYGLAVAQAQHGVRELADLLEARGIDVSYAIHPVAGRMPGHMNVLLAEANVPYPQLKEMDDINPEFERTDVALVVGANDVTNPAARADRSSPIYGMPILDVDKARSVIVVKRSMGRGYAGIDNPLYVNPKTGMFFADAKKGIQELIAAVKAL
ncbi:MAG TPA: NAD(P)(+) transhydrogenase (Re/Si-specific) subunit beta [Candidatus Limnocylindrales bacterium]|jgi:NAD(P) transhydrogenase subunit beta